VDDVANHSYSQTTVWRSANSLPEAASEVRWVAPFACERVFAAPLRQRMGSRPTRTGMCVSLQVSSFFLSSCPPVVRSIRADARSPPSSCTSSTPIRSTFSRAARLGEYACVCSASNARRAIEMRSARAMSGDPKLVASQDLPDFRYARYAESLGLRGIRVEQPDAIADAWISAFAADHPVLSRPSPIPTCRRYHRTSRSNRLAP
jgi:hypothetical protein